MKADLHIHTSFSCDGIHSPKEIINSAIEKGIDCVCITDHNEIRGAVEAMKFSFDKNILVIPGIEILSKSGDVLAINVKKLIPDGLSLKETIKEIRKQKGIAVIPHLFDPTVLNFKGIIREVLETKPDALEILNALSFFNFSNKKVSKFSQKKDFPFTAGSDAHRKEFVGSAYIETFEKVSSEKDLIDAIMNKKVKIGGDHQGFIKAVKNVLHFDKKRALKYIYLKAKN